MDLDIGADAEATLPALIEACKKLITPDRKRAMQERGRQTRGGAQSRLGRRIIELAAVGWDASPVSLARLCAELWPLIKNDDWSLVSWQGFISELAGTVVELSTSIISTSAGRARAAWAMARRRRWARRWPTRSTGG